MSKWKTVDEICAREQRRRGSAPSTARNTNGGLPMIGAAKGAVMNKRNRARAAWAKVALTAFTDVVGKSDPATEIADLIGDLMHLARTHRLHPLDVASHGIGMWSAEERAPDGEPEANDDAHIAISRGHI